MLKLMIFVLCWGSILSPDDLKIIDFAAVKKARMALYGVRCSVHMHSLHIDIKNIIFFHHVFGLATIDDVFLDFIE